jgi:preprotein translocase subunit SecG
MMGLVVVIHIIICVGLIGIILIQRGRGGGLVDSFSGLDSVFGTKTSAFLTKLTTVLAITFFFTCLTLAFLSLQQSRSLMRGVKFKSPVGASNTTINATASAVPDQQKSAAVKEQIPVNNTKATAPANK